ncbi:MAG: SDR family oxidoreductase [Candidatus Nanohaloarchaea archaeon]|nr:SDR family oxidoreductase [Candidatus Nanohaloarchaea archaeon]
MAAVIVTGASSGIGKATVEELVEGGDTVYGLDKDVANGRELEETLDSFHFRECDVTDSDRVSEVIQDVGEEHQLRGLVNNAAVAYTDSITEFAESDWDSNLDVIVHGARDAITAAVPYLRETGGAVVNVSSVFGFQPEENFLSYSVSKGALNTMTKQVAKQYAGDIRVNAVAPSMIRTPMAAPAIEGDWRDGELVDRYLDRIPMQRMGTPEEVASTIAFLLSDDASYITGEILKVDGGYLI